MNQFFFNSNEWYPPVLGKLLVKVTSYILLATELFSYIPKNKVIVIILHIILLCVHSLKLSHVKLPPYHVT